MRRSFMTAGIAAALAFGCAPADKPEEAAAKVAPFAHEGLPAEGHATFVDFGGKVQLVGFDVSPDLEASPGTTVKAKLYWRRTNALEPGWSLFTHLEDDRGQNIANLDKQGPFRTALATVPEGLSQLELGKVYTDEQTFQIPEPNAVTPRVTLVVGVWRDTLRLPVVSGQSNGHDAAILTHFLTGVPSRAPARPQG